MEQSDDARFAPPLDDDEQAAGSDEALFDEGEADDAAVWPSATGAPESQLSQRLRDLNLAIEAYPDAVANYVLRGEMFLKDDQRHLAQADFEQALRLAVLQIESSRWGLIEQAMLERAQQGLDRVGRMT